MDQEAAEHHMLLRKCRLCAKSFPCGRSLSAHMRCHLSSSFSTNGYGLREDPKKTRRLSSDTHPDGGGDGKQRQCRDCGKLFRSWPALFGHTSCPSRRKNRDADPWSVPKRETMPRPRCPTSEPSSPPEYEEEFGRCRGDRGGGGGCGGDARVVRSQLSGSGG